MTDTLPKLLSRNARDHGGDVAMREKQYGIWRAFTWAEVEGRTRPFALGLRSLGLGAGDVVTGPAVIEEFGSTVPVHPGFCATVDRFGNLLLTRVGPHDPLPTEEDAR